MNVKFVLRGYWAHTHCSMIALGDSTGSGNVTCFSFVCAGILYVTNTENKLSEVHARLMAQNISLHSLLEEAERLHKQNSITRGNNSPPSSSGEHPDESDNRTGIEKLRIETTV